MEIALGIRLVELRDRRPDLERRADRAFRVVLVRDRRPEQRHDGIPDELLDRPSVALELVLQPGVVGLEHRADVLGVERLGSAREPDEVGEEHGDDLALLANLTLGERRAAREAEPRDLGVVLPAGGADRHAESLRPGGSLLYAGARPT